MSNPNYDVDLIDLLVIPQLNNWTTRKLITIDYTEKKPIILADYLIILHAEKAELKAIGSPEEKLKDLFDQIENLIKRLKTSGADIEVKVINLKAGSRRILIFVHFSDARIGREAAKSKQRDTLLGIGGASRKRSTEITPAERSRYSYDILVSHFEDQGAHVRQEEEPYIEVVTPFHDDEFNQKWLTKWTSAWWVEDADINQIKDHFGEKVGFYFAFLKFYTLWLIIPAIFGALSYFHYISKEFSPKIGFFSVIWSLLFIIFWKRKERALSVHWQCLNCAEMEPFRIGFRGDCVYLDNVTGEMKQYYSGIKRGIKRFFSIPKSFFFLLTFTILFSVLFLCEFFLHEVYHGPMNILVRYVPTVLYAGVLVPMMSGRYHAMAVRLTKEENYEKESEYNFNLTVKVFVFNCLTAYLPIVLIAIVFFPFASFLLEKLIDMGLDLDLHLHPKLIGHRLCALLVTGQVVNCLTEIVVPQIVQRGKKKASGIFATAKTKFQHPKEGQKALTTPPPTTTEEVTNEQIEADVYEEIYRRNVLPEYDTFPDYAEMVTQFGYTCMFSIMWPLAPVASLVNNIIELRSDGFRLTENCRRPRSVRVDGIGPWLRFLELLSWISAISNASFACFYFNWTNQKEFPLWFNLFLVIFIEHLYFLASLILRYFFPQDPEWVSELLAKEKYQLHKKMENELTKDASASFTMGDLHLKTQTHSD